MKKLIASSRSNSYDRSFTYNVGKQAFSVKVSDDDDPYRIRFQISEIHPYDLTEYAWAKKTSPMEVSFYDDGHLVDTMTISDYDDDYFESVEDYFDTLIDTVCRELQTINKDKKPMIDRT